MTALPPGRTPYADMLRQISPSLYADLFCPLGEYHTLRKRFLRNPVCSNCGHRRSWR